MIHLRPSPLKFERPEVELSDGDLKAVEGVLKTSRDGWQQARHSPNQDFSEDDLHDTISVLNDLINRVRELQLTEAGGAVLQLNTPREMDEILFSILSVLHAISEQKIDFESHDREQITSNYGELLSKFTTAHWQDNPLAEYWHEFGEHTPNSPSDPIIEAIAKQGERTHILRELIARSNPSHSMSAYENPERLNANPDDPDDIAQKFIRNWDETRRSMGSQSYQNWLEDAEAKVGRAADHLCEP